MPRPEMTSGSLSLNQDKLQDEFPLVIAHETRINVSGGHVVIPPFVATYKPEDSNDESASLVVQGDSIKSLTVLGGAGVIQAKNLTITGKSQTQHGDAAIVSKDTYRLDVVSCSIRNDGNAMVTNGGQINSYKGTSVDVPGWGVKATNYGRFTGKEENGSPGGDAYVAESGFITFNEGNKGGLSGRKSASDNGIIINQHTSEMWGPSDPQKLQEIMWKTGQYNLPQSW